MTPTIVLAQTKISDLPNYNATSFELVPKVEKEVITTTYDDLVKTENSRKFWDVYNDKATTFGNDKQK